jgi:hypothetical protein
MAVRRTQWLLVLLLLLLPALGRQATASAFFLLCCYSYVHGLSPLHCKTHVHTPCN